MTPETIMHPNISIWPFESFRSFGPMFEKSWPLTGWTPLCDIYETDKEIVLKMELPETRKEDVHVTLENNVLTLRGERKFEEAVNREKYYRIERMYGEFTRIFTLPTFIEGSKVFAEFNQGMLTVTLPKNGRSDTQADRSEVDLDGSLPLVVPLSRQPQRMRPT